MLSRKQKIAVASIMLVLVILIIFFAYAYTASSGASSAPSVRPKTFTPMPNYNYIFAAADPGVDSPDGNIQFLGVTDTEYACQDKCAGTANCKAYTWHDDTNGVYSRQCYGVANPVALPMAQAQPGHFSGALV